MDRTSDTTLGITTPPVAGTSSSRRHRVGRSSQAAALSCTHGGPATAGKLCIASDDGVVSYSVGAAGSRLFIQRTQHSKLGTLAEQCLLIADRDGFRRWCAAEPTRFQYPILFDRLRRCGDELFDRTR